MHDKPKFGATHVANAWAASYQEINKHAIVIDNFRLKKKGLESKLPTCPADIKRIFVPEPQSSLMVNLLFWKYSKA